MKRSISEDDGSMGKKRKVNEDNGGAIESPGVVVAPPLTHVSYHGQTVLSNASPSFDGTDLRSIVRGFLPSNDHRAFDQTNKSCMETSDREIEVS
jgi:hypothetical protein